MPTIDKSANINDVLDRLLLLDRSISEQLAEVNRQSSKKKALKLKATFTTAFKNNCKEIAAAPAMVEKHGKGSLLRKRCLDLIRSNRERMFQIKKLTNVKAGDALDDFIACDVPAERIPELIAAYKQDTRSDGVWGGELEANHGATLLGFQCHVFIEANNRYKRVATVGAGVASTFHLLHEGNHYQVLLNNVQDGAGFIPVNTFAIAADGNCLYNSLRNIAGRLGAQGVHAPPLLQTFRQNVADALPDDAVSHMVTAIMMEGEFDGLGDGMRALCTEISGPAAFDEVDVSLYSGLYNAKTKNFDTLSAWGRFCGPTEDCIASPMDLDSLYPEEDDADMLAAMKTATAHSVTTIGPVHFAAWSMELSDDGIIASRIGREVAATGGGGSKKSPPDTHAEGVWYKANLKTLKIKKNLEACLYLEAHDSAAPCTDVCSPRLYMLACMLGKPILVYSHADWGHISEVRGKELLKRFSKQRIAKSKEGLPPFPIILFDPRGIFLVGLWDAGSDVFWFEAQKS